MAQIAVAPFVLKDVRLKIATDNYEKHVSSVILTPSTTTDKLTWQGLTPTATFTDSGVPQTTWEAQLDYAQDWETTNSLSQYLLDNAGQTKTIVFQPKAGTGKKTFTVTATIVPGPIGGAVNTVQTSQVTLPITGAPTVATDGVA